MLEIAGICKSYGKYPVLSGVDLKVEPGTCAAVAGRNGCGKTTLLSILAGALRPDQGTIVINGKRASGHPEVFSEETAYVPQENPLIEELSVKDNLLLWYRGDKKALERDLEEGPAAMLGIPAMLKKTCGKLSGGMKKRLSIACALSNHAPLLILDEPGAALDLECKEQIRNYLLQYMEQGKMVVMTSHEMWELSVCDRMYVLKEGRLTEVPKDLSAEELMKQF